MNYIIYDLEWDENGKKEIVEIGAIKAAIVNGKLEIVSRYQSFVRPTRHYYTYFCEQFTNISKETIDEARTFPEVLEEFIAWVGNEEHAYCTWGGNDKIIFHQNCNMNSIPIETWMNITNDVQLQISKLLGSPSHSRMSLKRAIEALEIEHIEGTYHRADFDAEGTAKVMSYFVDKIQILPNEKKQVVKKKKLDTNIDSFMFNDRKQMAAWMEGRLGSIMEHLPTPVQEQIMLDVIKWEEAKEELKASCLEIFNSEETQEVIQRGQKELYFWLKEKYPNHVPVMMSLSYGGTAEKDLMWRKHLFILTFHRNEKSAS